MQRPNDHKKAEILAAATRLFASKSYDQVSLDEIAHSAKVGKGTLYVYFESKEVLYQSLVRDGFRQLVDRVRGQLAGTVQSCRQRLEVIVEGLVDFAFSMPDLYRVMRFQVRSPEDQEFRAIRAELALLIETAIREGIAEGEIEDGHPELTAEFMISFLRGAMLYPPPGLTRGILRDHLMAVLWSGIGRRAAS